MMGGQMTNQSSSTGQVNPTVNVNRGLRDIDPSPGPSPEIIERQEKTRNNERQKKLVADTDKLLTLATELKSQVEKTDKVDKGAPPVDVVKKAEEIEKLAKSVRDRMKG